MELVYLWIEKFRNLEKVGLSFSNSFDMCYDEGNLTYKENDEINFFDSFDCKNRISNVTALVGKNGCGKSNILELIGADKRDLLIGPFESYFLVYYDSNNMFYFEGNPNLIKNLNVDRNKLGYSLAGSIFFSNNLWNFATEIPSNRVNDKPGILPDEIELDTTILSYKNLNPQNMYSDRSNYSTTNYLSRLFFDDLLLKKELDSITNLENPQIKVKSNTVRNLEATLNFLRYCDKAKRGNKLFNNIKNIQIEIIPKEFKLFNLEHFGIRDIESILNETNGIELGSSTTFNIKDTNDSKLTYHSEIVALLRKYPNYQYNQNELDKLRFDFTEIQLPPLVKQEIYDDIMTTFSEIQKFTKINLLFLDYFSTRSLFMPHTNNNLISRFILSFIYLRVVDKNSSLDPKTAFTIVCSMLNKDYSIKGFNFVEDMLGNCNFKKDLLRVLKELFEVSSDILNYSKEFQRIKNLLLKLEDVPDIYVSQKYYVFNISDNYNLLNDIFRLIDQQEILFDDAEVVHFKNLSTGESTFLNFYSNLNWALSFSKQIQSYYKNTILLFDEPDDSLHPEWKRCFLYELINFLNSNDSGYEKFQIILATHSPYLLSDLPSSSVIRLEYDEQECIPEKKYKIHQKDSDKYLGANIHELLFDKFFLSSAIGEYGKTKINKLIKLLAPDTNLEEEDRVFIANHAQHFIDEVAEPILKKHLQQKLSTWLHNNGIQTNTLDDQIADKERELAELIKLKELSNDSNSNN